MYPIQPEPPDSKRPVRVRSVTRESRGQELVETRRERIGDATSQFDGPQHEDEVIAADLMADLLAYADARGLRRYRLIIEASRLADNG